MGRSHPSTASPRTVSRRKEFMATNRPIWFLGFWLARIVIFRPIFWRKLQLNGYPYREGTNCSE